MCQPPTPIDCGDNDACTVDTCLVGVCYHERLCPSDGAICNGIEYCEQIFLPVPPFGFFIPQCFVLPIPCDDGLGCTLDFCAEPGGCGHQPVVCNDSDPCTANDRCLEPTGTCAYDPVTCDDGDVCTTEECVTGFGCFPTTVENCCHDASECPDLPCALQRTCTDDRCAGGVPPSCDDGDPGTVDACDAALGACTHVPGTPGPGPGATTCTGDAQCAGDEDPCTTAACVGGSCAQQPIAGVPGVACTCDRPVPAACSGQTAPRRVGRALQRACKIVPRLAGAEGRKRTKLVRKVAKQFDRAQQAAGDAAAGKKPSLSSPCATALAALYGDNGVRARRLEGQP